ncbi:unnamed protein product [Ilex paraguariensis]|uniref:Protein kinase domain-containing protein n=1 Tax=Ilex paraguariensis TaxID=185542 RepID=A0ABC8RU55_9AQUA
MKAHDKSKFVFFVLNWFESSESVLITSNGAWKLGGFGFTISADRSSADLANVQTFHYAEYDVEDSVIPLQPSLNYLAPELVQSKTSSVGCFSDIFSFGCLTYHLIARKPLFDCHNNMKMTTNLLLGVEEEFENGLFDDNRAREELGKKIIFLDAQDDSVIADFLVDIGAILLLKNDMEEILGLEMLESKNMLKSQDSLYIGVLPIELLIPVDTIDLNG